MARLAHISAVELERALELRDKAKTAFELRKALSVILIAKAGLAAEQAAEILGMSGRTLFRNRRHLQEQDAEHRSSWGGRRRCVLSIEEEREFLAQWEPVASRGGVLAVPPIHAALVEKLGHAIPLSTTYRLLARHGWRKVQPDTKHPKSDPAAQEEFKKNSPKLWKPPA